MTMFFVYSITYPVHCHTYMGLPCSYKLHTLRLACRKEKIMDKTPHFVNVCKFTASIIVAINTMIKLLSDAGLREQLKGERLTDITKLPQPVWGRYFLFFQRITASPIRKKLAKKGAGFSVLEREVQFWYKGVLVARVYLKGVKPDGTKGSRDNNTGWAVRKIDYAMKLGGTSKSGLLPCSWKKFNFEILASSYTRLYMQ